MERLTTKDLYGKREMICRFEDCDTTEEHCPHINEDNCFCLQSILKRLGEYEDIGTVEQFKIAIDRTEEKKPYVQSDGHGETSVNCCECPSCDSFIGY